MIKTQVLGNLGKDAVVNQVNGKNVINFSVAHTKSYTDRNGQKIQSTTWVDCAWWLEKTTIAQYLKKGQQVWVDGEPMVDTYKNQSGETKAVLRLRVHELQLCGGSKEQTPQQASMNAQAPSSINEVEDDLPF